MVCLSLPEARGSIPPPVLGLGGREQLSVREMEGGGLRGREAGKGRKEGREGGKAGFSLYGISKTAKSVHCAPPSLHPSISPSFPPSLLPSLSSGSGRGAPWTKRSNQRNACKGFDTISGQDCGGDGGREGGREGEGSIIFVLRLIIISSLPSSLLPSLLTSLDSRVHD